MNTLAAAHPVHLTIDYPDRALDRPSRPQTLTVDAIPS